jgi:hypothetical protein
MSERTFAMVDDGVIVGFGVAPSLEWIIARADEGFVDITTTDPRPNVGWQRLPDGSFTPPPAFSREEAAVKAQAVERVNQLAGECRAKYLTVVPGQSETYLLKADELRAYDAASIIYPSDYPILLAEATATGATLAEVVALVRATRAAWLQLAAAVEGMRRGAIVAIQQATSEAAVHAAIPVQWP